MSTFAIESNGLLEKTAVYINGEQISGIKEIYIYLAEAGDFDTFIQYEGIDKNIYTLDIFKDELVNINIVPPSFTEDEAKELKLLTIDSDGEINNTMLYYDNDPLDSIVSVYLHIKSYASKSSIYSQISLSKTIPDIAEFVANITFRDDNDALLTEDIF